MICIHIYLYIYNLILTRPGVNIIEAEFDLKDHKGYFTFEHSLNAFSDRE
jgi:hypothetical protein